MEVQLIEMLINLVQSASVELWRIAGAQVVASTITQGVWAVLLSILGSLSVRWGVRELKKEMAEFDEMMSGSFFLLLLGSIALIFTAVLTTNAVMYILNPDYQAIRVLISLTGQLR